MPVRVVTRFVLVLMLTAISAGSVCRAQNDVDWPAYNGGRDGDHYSRLRQINRGNVHELKVAWTYDTGEKGGIQTNPLIAGGTLYAFTPSLQVIALDAATGKLQWKFDPGAGGGEAAGIGASQPSRGLTWWTDGKERRLFAGVMNFLYCLDPASGKPVTSFGENGRIDLRKGLREPYERQSIVLTTPGIVYRDMIIVGGREPETHPAPPGDIRAFDVHTGGLRWTFHTIPHPGEPGYETWPTDAWKTAGSANNWAGMSLDVERGILYVPTGSAVMDFYGGDRVGDDLYADTLLALDAATGKRLWHFQGVHHDIWDRDFPAPPALFTLHRGGKTIDAMAQTSKQGYVYLFNRLTGEPLFPIHEHEYPASTVPGEVAAKTQPLPDWPEPYARQRLTEEMLTTRTPEMPEWAVKAFRTFRSDGQFVPFVAGGQQTVVFPGFDGGGEWGGPAVDPVHGVLYVNANEMVWTGGLVAASGGGSAGERTYRQQCAVCHGIDRAGSPPAFPSLIDVSKRLTAEKIAQNVHQGNGRMPSFPNLDEKQVGELIAYLGAAPATPGAGKKEMAPDAADGAGTDKAGAEVYAQKCGICHGDHREGIAPSFPMLIGLGTRETAAQVTEVIQKGKNVMPGQPDLTGADLEALLRYLGVGSKTAAQGAAAGAESGAGEYDFTGYRQFLDPDGYPAFQPPWGTLSAIDLNSGKYLWKVNLGEYPALAAKGMKDTGSQNYGGPIVTAGGVLFIGATVFDHKFRAFDVATGKLLWEADLPFAGVATPATYEVGGKQYVVIAASNMRTPKDAQGGVYVAFALP